MKQSIPIIDLFAGPGGLGEGFSAFEMGRRHPFRIGLSIEKDVLAHQTLKLRSFFRQFEGRVPDAYYDRVRTGGQIEVTSLYEDVRFRNESLHAAEEAQNLEIGPESLEKVDRAITKALGKNASHWVLIGGPPCQAYSLVGRSRMRNADRQKFESDPRHTLYKEYLRILARFEPAVFVFENVKGLLSSTLNGDRIFHRIFEDLSRPGSVPGLRVSSQLEYEIRPITVRVGGGQASLLEDDDASRFIVEAERFGIPQARHRVILVGVRTGLRSTRMLQETESVPASAVIDGLPVVRSGLSKERDSPREWSDLVRATLSKLEIDERRVARISRTTPGRLHKLDRGGEFVPGEASASVHTKWFQDDRIGGVLNHSTRSHIREDLERYIFAASFARFSGLNRSPRLSEFPPHLLPNHRNVDAAVAGEMFGDRFRVQLPDVPSTTITSHISKDGHYYIHYDPLQARSLTVREAARLQTFPDNYFFCGPRTSQYHQVGNAVPPLLARQIAQLVYDVLT